jgi:hypothetical protein
VAIFSTEEGIVLSYSNVGAAKQWWINTFDCKQRPVPADWDDIRPSDVALELPGGNGTILLCDRADGEQEGPSHPMLDCSRSLHKAKEYLLSRGVQSGPIQDDGSTQYFEIRDPEGNVIEIC